MSMDELVCPACGYADGHKPSCSVAAASDLLEALKKAADWLPYHEPSHPDYEGGRSDVGRAARAAIAKAEGK